MSRRFWLYIFAFLLLVFLMEWNAPRQFQWNPTYRSTDRQPLGCFVMDSVLSVSMPHGYRVTRKTLSQLSTESHTRCAVLIVGEDLQLGKADDSALIRMLRRGDRVIIAVGYSYGSLSDSLGVGAVSGNIFNDRLFRQYAMDQQSRKDTLHWTGHRPYYPIHDYSLNPGIQKGEIEIDSATVCDTLVEKWDRGDDVCMRRPCAITIHYGKGQLTLCSMPLLFTNYSILDDDGCGLVMRLMSETGGLPVVRTEAYLKQDETSSESPLRFFLTHPPLRWAVYLTMTALILFFVFGARRRLRIYPLMPKPVNRSLEFVRLIGTLYYQRHDNADLLKKKFVIFAEQLRQHLSVDVSGDSVDVHQVRVIAEHTGMDQSEISSLLEELRVAIKDDAKLTDSRLRRLIDMMNGITSKLSKI